MSQRIDPVELERYLQDEGNRALAVGSRYASWFGWIIGALLLVAVARGDRFFLPCAFSFFAAAVATLMWSLARRGRVRGAVAWAMALAFVSLPSTFFVAARLLGISGVGDFLTGAISYLYAFTIVITGFLFVPRLSVVASLVCAAEFLALFFAGRSSFDAIVAPNGVLQTDLTAPFVWINKAFMIVGTGLATGALGRLSRRLLIHAVVEEREKSYLSRLFGQYVSDEVRQAILEQTRESRGERKQVAVLFSDLRGFSTFAEGRDPAEVVARLNAYLERMVAAIVAERGVVDKFIGDAVMAVFGGVLAVDDPAGAAVRAAMRMRRSLGELNTEWAKDGIAPFENGIGIHFGEVLQGPIGSEHRREFTVIGDTVNTASRVEGLTKEKGAPVLVTGEAFAQLGPLERDGFRALGEAVVKGRARPVAIYGA